MVCLCKDPSHLSNWAAEMGGRGPALWLNLLDHGHWVPLKQSRKTHELQERKENPWTKLALREFPRETGVIIIPNTVAASSTHLAKMPGTSIEFTSGIRPWRETRPYVGFKPTTPQWEAGFLVDPPVSDPRALWLKKKIIITAVRTSHPNLLCKNVRAWLDQTKGPPSLPSCSHRGQEDAYGNPGSHCMPSPGCLCFLQKQGIMTNPSLLTLFQWRKAHAINRNT